MARSQFVDAIKTNATAATAAMSFFAAVAGFAAAFGGGLLIALLLIATLLLVSYNIWLWRDRRLQRSRYALEVKEEAGARRRRLILHATNALLLVSAWIAVGLFQYPGTKFALQYSLVGCDFVEPGLTNYLEGGDSHNARLQLLNINCLGELGGKREMITAIRASVNDTKAWAAEREPRRSRELAILHLRIALEAPELDDGERAAEARRASEYMPDDPRVLPLVAFAAAVQAKKGDQSVLASIENRLRRAEMAAAQMSASGQEWMRATRLYWGGRAFERAGAYTEAEQMFRERLTIGDVSGSTRDLARLHLGLVLFDRDSSRDEALKVWSQVKNEKLLGAAYSVRAVHAAFEAQTASEPRRTELRREAEALSEKAVMCAEGRDPTVTFQTATVRVLLGEPLEALANLLALEKQFPTDADYPYWAGRAASDANRLTVARTEFEHVLALDPESVAGNIWLGRTLLRLGDLVGAERQLRRATDLDPENPEALLWLALVFAEKQELAFAPGEKVAANQIALGFLFRAKASVSIKGDAKMLADIQNWLPIFLNNAAYLYAADPSAINLARNYAQQSLDLQPDDPDALDTMAYVVIREVQLGSLSEGRSKKLREASDMLTRALARYASDKVTSRAEAVAHLGMIAELLNDVGEARRRYLEALSLDPTNATAIEAAGRLAPSDAKPN
jgi:tetratricopeptide (TPR) repeat protein